MRVFISYSHDSPEHMDRVWDLCERSRQDGIDCRIDQHEFSPAEAWPRWCRNQIQESNFVLVVCTATYKRRYEGKEPPGKGLGAKWEGYVITQELYEAEGKNAKFIPVVFAADDLAHVPLELRGATHYDLSADEGYDSLFRHLTYQPPRRKSEVAPEIRPMPTLERRQRFLGPLWNVPLARNPFFTGRKGVLKNLESVFKRGEVAALTGLPGVGKTETAARYAYLHRAEYSAAFWASAASRETLTSGYATVASLLNLPESQAKEQEVAIAAVKRWLESESSWLLILDNAVDVALAGEFIPAGRKGHVLLTTQARATGALAQAIEIEDMPPKEGALFLLRRVKPVGPDAALMEAKKTDRELAQRISEELGGLPLALDQAGAYVEEAGWGLAAYLELYRARGAELRRKRGALASSHPQSVATTFALSFGNVERANPAAAELLRFCAFLHPDAIPEEIITDGAAELGPVLGFAAQDPLRLNTAFGEILKFSLLRRDASARTLSMHRLVQAVLKDGTDVARRREWAERTVRAVNRAFPFIEFASWLQCERLLPSALAGATLIEHWGSEFVEAARLLNQAGLYLYERGRFAEAEPLFRRALAIKEKALGPEHPDVARVLENHAALLRETRREAEAEKLEARARTIRAKHGRERLKSSDE